jgi:hypothetical protein
MKRTCFVSLFLFNALLFNSLTAQIDTSGQKVYSVVVMPFYDNLKYPYDRDLFRESVIRSLSKKGYYVILDDSTWSVILDLNLNPSKIFPDDADSVAKSIDVDIIIFGYLNFVFFHRGVYSPILRFKNPIPIRIYDSKKKEIVWRESLYLIEKRELIVNKYTFEELGDYIVRRLEYLGYKIL